MGDLSESDNVASGDHAPEFGVSHAHWAAGLSHKDRRSEDLLVDLQPELVRGVPMSNILRRFGLEWRRGSERGSFLWRPELSKQTQRYSFFFSHDWETSRWMKYLSLVIYFNSRAAATATCVMSLALGVLSAWTRDMPDGWILPRTAWWTVLGHVVGIVFLLFWQHLCEIFWGSRFGFLDRLCIPQDDPEKKNQCVYALASFLNKSDDLIVLWSPRYWVVGVNFCNHCYGGRGMRSQRRPGKETRDSRPKNGVTDDEWSDIALANRYEIACFLIKRKEANRIKFLPVQISVIWILTYFAVSTTWLSFLLVQRFGNELFDWHETSGKINVGVMIAIQVGVLYPPLFYLMNQMLFDMAQLPTQLQSFDIETAECFCCSNNHRDPVTGEQIQCDRELIYGVLQLWSSGSTALEEGSVQRIQHVFKSHLDKHLRISVEQAFTHSGILMRPLMSAAAIGSFPFLCDFIGKEGARVVQIWPRPSPINNFGLAVYMLFWMPIFLRSLLMLSKSSTLRWNRSRFKCIVIACQAVSLLLMGLLFIVGYLVCIAASKDNWTSMTSPTDPLPLYLLSLVILGSVIFGLRHLCPCRNAVIIGGAPPKARKKPASPLVALGLSDAKDVHAPAMTAGASVVSEESTFEI
ncbi:smd2 [Symbiodinium sp. CCMP2592]|nr:smd2 [Symbiodinium sp. CCMP2592]